MRVILADLVKELELTQSNDPITKWAEDGAKIELLTNVLDSLRQNPQPQSDAIERITVFLEALRWKRCDLGRLLLQGRMPGWDEEQLVSVDRKGSVKSQQSARLEISVEQLRWQPAP
jgi:hypothetical protein